MKEATAFDDGPDGCSAIARVVNPRDPYQVMPALSDEDFAALKSDIAERGVQVPVEYDQDGNVIDGHHRVRACEELGITEWPRTVRVFESEAEKRTHARRLNIARRHLDQAQKRELIAAELKDRPDRSNRQIAAGIGVHHETVGVVREELAGRGEIRHVETVTDTKGRSQPARRRKATTVTAEAILDDGFPYLIAMAAFREITRIEPSVADTVPKQERVAFNAAVHEASLRLDELKDALGLPIER